MGEESLRQDSDVQTNPEAIEDLEAALKGEIESLRRLSGGLLGENDALKGEIESLEETIVHLFAHVDTYRSLSSIEQNVFLAILENRFIKDFDHYKRPKGVNFADVKRALLANNRAMWSIAKMEASGGAPDIVFNEDDTFVFADCSKESPAGRRNCVYDKKAEKDARDFNGNAVDMAKEFGIALWSESFYRAMRKLGKFDTQTTSWIKTEDSVRKADFAHCCNLFDGNIVNMKLTNAHHHSDVVSWRGELRVQKVPDSKVA